MFDIIALLLIGIGGIVLSIFLKNNLVFDGNTSDYFLFWGSLVFGIIFVLWGLILVEREFGIIDSIIKKSKAKKAKKNGSNESGKADSKAANAVSKNGATASAKVTASGKATVTGKASGVGNANATSKGASQTKSANGSKKSKIFAKPNPNWSFKTSGADSQITVIITIAIIHAIVLAIACYVMTMLSVIEKMKGTFHWVPIVLAVVAYLFVSVGVFELDANNSLFKKISVYHRTVDDVYKDLDKILKSTGYAYYHKIVTMIGMPVLILEAGIASIISPFALNFLVATPMILFIMFLYRKTITAKEFAESFMKNKAGDDWKQYTCSNCGAYISKFPISDSTTLVNKSESLGSSVSTVTDVYSNGWDKIYVDRQEKSYHIDTRTTYHSKYHCERCGYKWEETKTYDTRKNL